FWQAEKKGKLGDFYKANLDPANFVDGVDNPYYTLVPGTQFVYEAKKAEGTERTVVTVTSENKIVMGITAVVARDQVFLNGELIEDTDDWYAQDREGNVWYLGEITAEYEDGELVTTAGSWEAGVDGAQAGIIMKGNPKVGDSYWQEYYKGEAEDRGEVLAVNETVTVPFGTYSGCVKTLDYTPLDKKALEHKYYCANVGAVVLEVDTEDNERVELISVKTGVPAPVSTLSGAPVRATENVSDDPKMPAAIQPEESGASAGGVSKPVTEAEAKAIALARVPGVVTDVAIETKFGKQTYVVEVDATNGPETDVIIEIATGAVLAVEE
ncbi:PepSY domain-containing protein, partial [Candidatus Parcubacteria bacterium]|nr:PepSY domain-containing protein [Candidatus Parcubacteria bacterium]